MLLFILYLFTSLASIYCFSSTGYTRYEDVVGLQALYNSTVGPSWTYTGYKGTLVKWNFDQITADPCTQKWAGVTCSNTNVVSQLKVSRFGLNGKVPKSFALVIYLTGIDVSLNKLTNNLSDLLDILYSCSSLYTMLIDRNYLTGSYCFSATYLSY